MSESERRPLVELDTIAPKRPYVTIDKTHYDLRLINEFTAREHAIYSRDSRQYDELWNSDEELSEADEKRMEELLDRLLDYSLADAVKLREAVGERLTAPIKREIVLTFSNAPLLMAAMAQMDEEEKKAKTATRRKAKARNDSSTTAS